MLVILVKFTELWYNCAINSFEHPHAEADYKASVRGFLLK